MDQLPRAIILGLGVFALNLILLRRSHRTWTNALVQAAAVGVGYGVGWIVVPDIGQALGHEVAGIIGLIGVSVVVAGVIYVGLRDESSRV